jgi:3-phosphoshikimate 1-carboxyvinyltransferase
MRITALKLTPTKCPVAGEIRLHGSKSYANRALCIAAIAEGKTTLANFSDSDDSARMINAIAELGGIISGSSDIREISPIRKNLFERRLKINVGLAGTTSRFLTALCSALPLVEVELTGERHLLERPIGDLVSALRDLGADITYLDKEGSLPLLVKGRELEGGACRVNGSTSSQFLTSLLLIAPLLKNGLEVEIQGELTSRSYVDMTIEMMHQFSVVVENKDYRVFKVGANSNYLGRDLRIEGDATGAGYLWGIAALGRGRVKTYGLNLDSLQGDLKLLDIYRKMGCSVYSGTSSNECGGGDWIEVVGGSRLRATDANLELLPDSAQTLAVVAACAEGISTFTGLHTLKVKETDRLLALRNELSKLGIVVEYGDDWLRVSGGSPRVERIATYDDHRMAMSFAMLGAILPGIEIEEPEVVSKSFPRFWEVVTEIGIANEVC